MLAIGAACLGGLRVMCIFSPAAHQDAGVSVVLLASNAAYTGQLAAETIEAEGSVTAQLVYLRMWCSAFDRR
jgi:hypothetical protein